MILTTGAGLSDTSWRSCDNDRATLRS